MQCKTQFRLCSHSLADPYLTIREGVEGGGGGGHPDPEIRGGAALRVSVWSKNKGGVRDPPAPPLDPPLTLCRIDFAPARLKALSDKASVHT